MSFIAPLLLAYFCINSLSVIDDFHIDSWLTAVAKTADEAHQALRDENLDLIKGEKHLATLDTRTSEVCRVRDGLMWDIDKKPIDHDLPYRRPPLHPRCRSILQLVLKSWKELGFDDVDEIPESTRASMDGQVSENINYENWLKGKSQAEQDAVLGKGKADLWRRGVITFRDMLDQSGRPLTLRELSGFIGGSRWKQHLQSINIPVTLPENLQEVVKIGQELHRKYKEVIEQAIINEKPHEGIMEIMKLEGVEIGGKADIVGIEKGAIEALAEATGRYPKAWVDKSNQLGRVFIREYKERGYFKHIPANYDPNIHLRWLEKEYSPLKAKGLSKLIKGNDSLIVVGSNRSHIVTAIHEFGHRLQQVSPELDRYFTDFWKMRTSGKKMQLMDSFKKPHDPFYYGKEKGKDGGFPYAYYGRMYGNELDPKPLEMLTMTFEALLSGNKVAFNDLREHDPELFNLGLSLLTRWKP